MRGAHLRQKKISPTGKIVRGGEAFAPLAAKFMNVIHPEKMWTSRKEKGKEEEIVGRRTGTGATPLSRGSSSFPLRGGKDRAERKGGAHLPGKQKVRD